MVLLFGALSMRIIGHRSKNFDVRLYMASLEVDVKTGCMYPTGSKRRRSDTCKKIWEFVTGLKFERYVNDTNMVLGHKCDQGHLGCCNFTHLEYVTNQKNISDAVNRMDMNSGVRNARVKVLFTQADRVRIKDLYDRHLSQREIAKEYGCSQRTIGKILKGKHWSQRDV